MLRSTDVNGSDITYAASIDTARRVITIDPTSNLSDGAVYVAVSDGYHDVHGNRGTAAHAIFTVAATPVQSSDATLSGLTASTSTSAGGMYTSLDIGTFAAATTRYTATVAHSITHMKLTPTANHAAAAVTVDGTRVNSGTASGPIALSVGANAITVRVTAQDSTTKDYTVTVTRAAQGPPAVTLSAAPNPVKEGGSVRVTARLGRALASAVTIPLALTRGTAESGDYGSLASITIAAGRTSATDTITTAQDDDTDDETFTVALGALPAAVVAGTTTPVSITSRTTTRQCRSRPRRTR